MKIVEVKKRKEIREFIRTVYICECPICGGLVEKKDMYAVENTFSCTPCSIELRTKWKTNIDKNLSHRWTLMIDRCYNPKSVSYPNYGAKGVYVCKEWRNNKQAYIDWCKSNGFNDTSLEIDKDILCEEKNISPKVYSPETCLVISKNKNRTISSQKKVVQMTLDGKDIKIWDSATEAKKHIPKASKIGEVCNGYRNKAGGYKWRYLDE